MPQNQNANRDNYYSIYEMNETKKRTIFKKYYFNNDLCHSISSKLLVMIMCIYIYIYVPVDDNFFNFFSRSLRYPIKTNLICMSS